MSPVEKTLNNNFSHELTEFLNYLHTVNCGTASRGIITSLEKIGNTALGAGFPGVFELCTTLVKSLDEYVDITDSIKTDLLQIFDLLGRYLSQPTSEDIKNNIFQRISGSSLFGNITDDELSILRAMFDLDSDVNYKNTEVGNIENNNNQTVDNTQKASSENTTESFNYNREINIKNNLPDDLKELLHIMQSELVPIDKQIMKAGFQVSNGVLPDNIKNDLTDCISSLDLYHDAVDSFDFKGLASIIRHIRNNIAQADDSIDETGFSNSLFALQPFFDHVFSYLEDPTNTETVNKIVNHLKSTEWTSGLSDNEIDEISTLLPVNIQHNDNHLSEASVSATAEDVSLSLPDDIDKELLDAMLHELPDQIEELSSCINKFILNGTPEDIQTAKRIAHTLKGAGNTVGIRGIAMITHKMEDILLALYKNNVLPRGDILNTLIRASDCLAAMGDYLLEIGEEPEDSLETLQQIIDLTYQIEKHGIKENNHSLENSGKNITNINDRAITGNNTKEELRKSLKVPMAFMDQLLKLVGESITSNKQILSSLHETIDLVKNNKSFYRELRFFGDKIEEIITTKDIYSSYDDNTNKDYDDLEMERFSDLHVYIHQLIEKTVDAEETAQYFLDHLISLNEKLIQLGRINSAIRDNVESNRLIPVSNYSSRLQRIVRQAANLAEKEVDMELSGTDTLIDSDILNNLIDSLIHLLRNAVDHGIENKNDRILIGKSPAGKIDLHFSADNNEIKISCYDDGRGLDIDSIRKKAKELGLLKEGDNISEKDIEKLIFHPDFSTKSEATELSGRGIGLDAVYSSIAALSGTISIFSTPGKGTRFDLMLPSNQMIVNVILVGMGADIVSLSSRGVDQIFYHDQVQFPDSEDDQIQHVIINNNKYQAITLESLLQFDYERRSSNRKFPLIILLNKSKNEKLAVLVDRIVGCENMVLKSMGNYVPNIPGIMGISILGDGDITSVIDLVEIVNNKPHYSLHKRRKHKIERKLPTALVVDDSLSVRKSLSEFMENIGYKVRAAHDGLEAFEIASACKPDIILTDMEMPRMNGIELSSHIKSSTELNNIPVIMITSRSADWHQKEAANAGIDAYLTKPYSEEELLDAIKRLNFNKD